MAKPSGPGYTLENRQPLRPTEPFAAMNDPVIANVGFTDGTHRAVFEQLDGRQYVLEEGERVFGVWCIPPDGGVDLPMIVPAQ
jgi:hypothetical protein